MLEANGKSPWIPASIREGSGQVDLIRLRKYPIDISRCEV
jgi:hypothetical protein